MRNKLLMVTMLVTLLWIGLTSLTPVSAAAKEEFKITPTTYNINLSSLQPVELSYTFRNSLSAQLRFELSFEAETLAKLKENQVEVYVANTTSSPIEKLSTGGLLVVDIKAQTDQVVKINFQPKQAVDFQMSVPLMVKQTSGPKLLVNNYKLVTNINSKLGESNQTSIQNYIAAILVVISVIALIVIVIGRFRAESDGTQSN